jgi:alpha-L-rhamnosidase
VPQPETWSARWIGRRVAAGHRVMRCAAEDHVAWASAGGSLGQRFTTEGRLTSVSVNLTHDPGAIPAARVELVDADGKVLAEKDLSAEDDWWAWNPSLVLAPDAPLPPGDYVVRLDVDGGRVGWPTTVLAPANGDDGLCTVPVRGTALRDGADVAGTRRIVADMVPAPNPVFRKTFRLTSEPRTAVLHAVGLGYGNFFVNGRPVTRGVLDPAPTMFDRTVLYRSYDVRSLLVEGVNEIRAELGRGFFAARGGNVWGWNDAPWQHEPVLIAQLEIEDDDGLRTAVASDESWQAAPGRWTSDLLYTGVTYDAGVGEDWGGVVVAEPPVGQLRPAALPEIVRRAPVPPIHAGSGPDGSTVYDFGVVLAGRIALTVQGERGTEVEVRYGELLSDDGSVLCDNDLAAGESQVDRYRAAGLGRERWEPEFSYKGFRYVSVAARGRAVVEDVVAVPLGTDVEQVGSFECSEETLAWIDGATARTFRNNLHGIPTDTPVYEKNGWTADAHLATEAVLHHFDLRTTFGKWLDDHADAQAGDGTVPVIVPTPGWGRLLDPAWSSSTVLIPWALYEEYGEADVLRRHFSMMTRYTDRVLAVMDDGRRGWPGFSFGDWLAPGAATLAPEGSAPTATMMVKHLLDRMARTCRVLGHEEPAARYDEAARRVAESYRRDYWSAAGGCFVSPGVGFRQTMNILPLAFGAVPDGDVASVVRALVRDVEDRAGGHLDCGAVGVKWLLPVLSSHGRDDLAVTVATQQTRPGWGVWRSSGGTLWESWDRTARSRNHYFLGSVSAWIQRRVGGLVSTAPGWSSFDVRPIVDDRITWAAIHHRTPAGEIAVRWRRRADDWSVRVKVPPGAAATVHLPGRAPVELTGGEHHVT